MSDTEATWKTKTKRFLAVAVIIALFIWAFSVAQGARDTANENATRLLMPTFEMNLLPGGPERLPEAYEGIVNTETESEISEEDYLWATVVLRNTGFGDAEETGIHIRHTAPLEHVLVSTAGWGAEASVESGDSPNVTVATVNSMNARDASYLFLAVSPEAVTEMIGTAGNTRAAWSDEYYEQLVQSVSLDGESPEGEGFETTLYGPGFVPAPSDEQSDA